MKAAFVSDYRSPFMDSLVADLKRELAARGHEVAGEAAPEEVARDARVVFNVTSSADPRPNYLRSGPSQFVCTLAESSEPASDPKREGYRVLVKTMSNLLAYALHRPERSLSYLITPELGCREVLHGPDHARRIADQVLSIADVRFVVENALVPDLPAELLHGDRATAEIAVVGRRLDSLGLLPSVLPLEEILGEAERRLVFKLFGIRQLSYGNLSARRDRDGFWMSGRGVDKSALATIGRDILLVTGFDEATSTIRCSVPPGTDPTSRVSVDAIEHYRIYREFPGVGAIIHVHAWLPGIESTLQSYPCGTYELAGEVLSLLRRAPDPNNAVVGLRNHGITATGPDLETLFGRIAGRLTPRVPMS